MGNEDQRKVDSLIATPYDLIVSEPQKMIPLFIEGISTAKISNDKYGTAKLYSNLALAYSSMGNYDDYRDAEINSIKLFEELGNEIELTAEYGSFGYHLRRTNLPRSKYYMLLAIKLGEKNNLLKDLTAVYDNYGTVLELDGSLDSALFYYEKGLQLKYKLSDSIGIPYSLNHLATIHASKGNIDKAFDYMAESDSYRAKEKNNYGRAENAVIKGELFYAVGKYDLAISKFNESLYLAKLIGNKHMAQYNYEKLSNIYEIKKDYEKAFINLKNHKSYRDSILNIETNNRIAELEIKFETEKKDKEISESKLQLNKQRNQILVVTVLVILLLIGIIVIYQFQKFKRRQIRKELELKNQLDKVEYENKISDEKLRISRELHDNIGSHLTFMISSIDNLTYLNKDGESNSKLNSLSNFGRSTLNELRQTIWAMKKSESTLSELVLKLNEFKKQLFTDLEIQINNNIRTEIILTSTQTLNLFRVVQEAIQNCIKYASASKININFNPLNKEFVLSIEDNGKGFDISSAQMGNGISNMKYRCKEAGGHFEILSNKNGTKIFCNVNIK